MKLPSHKDLNAYPAGVQTARLVDDGGCVFAESTVGSQRWLAIWPMGFVLDGQELRSDGRLVASIGEMVNLGGGEYKAAQFDFVQTLLDEPVPPVCRGGDYWLVTGIVK